MDTEAHHRGSRLKALYEDSFSQHLSEDALKKGWQRLRRLAEQFVVQQPFLTDLAQRVVPLLVALFVLSTVAGVLSANYWSQRESIAQHEFERARGLNAQGQHDRALRYLRSAAHLEHNNQEYQMELAATLIRMRRHDEARLQLHALLRKDPTNAEANLRLARIAADEGEGSLDLAVQYYQRAIYGLWLSDPSENRIRTRFELVDFLASQDRIGLLRAELIVLASDIRDEPEYLERTGFLLLYAQSPENAALVFERLLAITPNEVRAMGGMGKAQLELGNYPAAEQWLMRASRLNPRNPAIENELARVRTIRAINPMQRGLSRRARADRANALLAMNYHPLYACASGRILPQEVQEDLARARFRLQDKKKPTPEEDDVESDISLSRQLYTHLVVHCDPHKAPNELRSLMTMMLRN